MNKPPSRTVIACGGAGRWDIWGQSKNSFTSETIRSDSPSSIAIKDDQAWQEHFGYVLPAYLEYEGTDHELSVIKHKTVVCPPFLPSPVMLYELDGPRPRKANVQVSGE